MRPIRLEMSAFGPFKGTLPPISFEDFGKGIYLITGDTGAGKTTIFDAIMFALFEEVSAKKGKGENNIEEGSLRRKEMLHSDYAPRSEKTRVTFVFEENNHRYTVTRTIRLPKKTDGKPDFDAELTGDNIAPVSGSRSVTETIRNILIMDDVQFRQIVMLAQGEFKAFMQSKDDKRKEILGELFDSRPYRKFQDTLKAAESILNDKQKAARSDLESYLKQPYFYLPESTDEHYAVRFTPDHPELIQNLEALCTEDKLHTEQLDAQAEALSKRRSILDGQTATAAKTEDDFRRLDAARDRLAQLNSQQRDFDELARQKDETAKASRSVLPLMTIRQKTMLALKKAEADRYASERKAKAARDALALAEKNKDEAENDKKELNKLNEQIAALRARLSDYDALAQARADALEAEQQLQFYQAAYEKADTACKNGEQRLAEIAVQLTELADIDTLTERKRGEYDMISKRYASLTDSKKGLPAMLREAAVLQRRQQIAAETALQKGNERSEAEETYTRIHHAYLAGYAGVLAVQLEKDLSEKEEASCPVCGTRFSAHVPHAPFALPQKEDVTQSNLQQAEARRNTAEKAMAEADRQFEQARSACEEAHRNILKTADEELSDQAPWTWEKASGEELTAALERIRTERDSKAAELNEAQIRQQLKNRLIDEQARLTQSLDKNRNERSSADTAIKVNTSNLEHKTAEASRIAQSLTEAGFTYKNRDEAVTAGKSMLAQSNQLSQKIQLAENDHAEKSKASAACDTALTSSIQVFQDAAAEAEAASASAASAITAAGFADEAAYDAAIRRIGNENGERWIAMQEEKINNFHSELLQTQNRINDLIEATRDLARPDMEKLNAELAALGSEEKALDDERKIHHQHSTGHQNALLCARRTSDTLRQIGKAYAHICHLNALANGSNGTGGRRSFDGFVLSSTFEEVLQHASHYLHQMTGGKFILHHDTEAANVRSTSHADFRINVEDTLTGQRREVGSLSGGESFQVSMALALGLSDTVQHHASSVKIDAMFIDEGFGTLDSSALHQMLTTLSSLSGGKRQIGIISHVDALTKEIHKGIHVIGSKDREGSRIRIDYEKDAQSPS